MNDVDCLLAEIPNFGRVYDCGDCGNIHLTVGPVSLTLTPDAYMQLVTLVHTSAANFETWLHKKGQPLYGVDLSGHAPDDPEKHRSTHQDQRDI